MSQYPAEPSPQRPGGAPSRPAAHEEERTFRASRGPSRLASVTGTYEFGVTLSLALLIVAVSVWAPRFLSTTNLMNVARNFAFNTAAAVGEAFVILAGGIDLSVGSVISLAGVVTPLLLQYGWGLWTAIGAGVAVGALCGLFNGVLVTKAKMPPLIPTLGMLSIARGLALVITRGRPITDFGEHGAAFLKLGQGYLFGVIPYPVVYMALVIFLGWLVLSRTPFGYAIYAIGGNEEASRLAGIPVDRIKTLTYVISGAVAALTGILLASRLSVGNATNGQGDELEVIAAAVIGGISLSGGKGTVLGVLVGSAIIGVLRNAMVLARVSSFWQEVVIGSVIVLAVLLDRLRYRRAQ